MLTAYTSKLLKMFVYLACSQASWHATSAIKHRWAIANAATDATIELQYTSIYINILQYTTILPGLKRNAHANISNPCWDVVHKCLLRSQPSQHAILWIKSLSFFVCLIWCYMLLPNLLGLGFPDVACRWGWHSLGGCAARSSESNCLATVPEARSLVRRRVIIVIGRSRERSGIVKE